MQTIVRDLDLTEIIDGEEIMGPSPFGRHQDAAASLFDIINRHVRQNNLGKLFFSPLDVIFEEGVNRLQPDILFIRKENRGIFKDWVRGVPDMVCEIISPGSYEIDTGIKKAIYEKYRVPEYWIVIPDLQTVEVLTIGNDRYDKRCIAELEGVITSKAIEGLQINIREIFEQPW
ncbi:MAG: Uma2 family endonuclease [Candidatus Magnetominusculus sp. LBB02]|nr:Uma2 family endonuclease [Candidatus Magnetominusculus sp. LBB02]